MKGYRIIISCQEMRGRFYKIRGQHGIAWVPIGSIKTLADHISPSFPPDTLTINASLHHLAKSTLHKMAMNTLYSKFGNVRPKTKPNARKKTKK